MPKGATHSFKVLCHERAIKRSLKKIVKEKLTDTNNEILLTNHILSYLCGHCNKCGISVSSLKTHRRYKEICFTCHKKYKP